LWGFIFWFGGLMLAGAIAGALDPQNAYEAGQRVQELTSVFFFLGFGLSITLAVLGKLPGTRKGPKK
jgi:hypothetical protein